MTTDEQIADLTRRVSVQEYLHRYADENGSMRHHLNMVPYLALATFIGAGITYAMVGDLKSKKAPYFLGACILATGVVAYLTFATPPKWVHKIDYGSAQLVANAEPV